MKEEQDNSQEIFEEYSFMQEVIKDETIGSSSWRSRIGRVIGYGIVFGVAASIVFSALTPWMEEMFQNAPQQVEIPQDEDDPEEIEMTEESGSEEGDELAKEEAEEDIEDAVEEPPQEVVLTEEDYCKVVNVLNSIVTEGKKSIAVLSVVDPEKEMAVSSQAGVVLANNGIELLVLAQAVGKENSENLQISFSDGKPYKATIKMCDYNLGVGVYAVERSDIEEASWAGIEEVQIGNSNILEAGDILLAIGRPFGSDMAIGIGTLAPDDAVIELADGHYSLLCTNVSCEQSGSGILLNQEGALVGIIAPEALPEGSKGRIGGYGISDVKSVIELLSNGAAAPYTGIYGMDVSEELEEKNMPKGVYVKEVPVDSPAMAAGIQSGDIIYQAGETEIFSMEEYHNLLMKAKEGEIIKIHGYRQGAGDEYVEIEFDVTVGKKQSE